MERAAHAIDAATSEAIEDVVIDWLNKYAPDGSNLAITDYDNREQIERWVHGVWGRITHQLAESGLPYPTNAIIALAGKAFYLHICAHPQYGKLRRYLPRPVTMHEVTEKAP